MIKNNVSMIVAVDKNFGIGKDNGLLCYIEDDLKYFKSMTLGHVTIMGYNTYNSLPIKPLPDRTNIVLTRKAIELDGAIVMNSIEEVLEAIDNEYSDRKIFICGGESIYRQFIDMASKIYITHIFESFDADTYFPSIEGWKLADINASKADILNTYPHVFTTYEREYI